MDATIVPLSAILPTRNRATILARFFDSLEQQDTMPAEMVICDASSDDASWHICKEREARWGSRVQWIIERAHRTGLAPQRNQAVAAATQPFVWFLDDDMLLEPGCVRELFQAVTSSDHIGGVTATLINEPYHPPGKATRALMRWFEHGIERESYASACVGPGWTFLHDTSADAPALLKAEWLGGGCTIYRKVALPVPAVPDHFEAGAIGEDLAASLTVGQRWQMFHVPAACAIHDSQGGDHKRSMRVRADQGLRNRFYIMTRVMGKDTPRDVFDFALMFAFILASLLSSPSQWSYLLPNLAGMLQGTWKLLTQPADA
jgi:glycosyltransferase involved in cell wall biosynthesis